MAAPGSLSKLDAVADELKDERLKLALAEGHDADIPSNLGVFDASDEKEAQRNVASTSEDESSDEPRDPNIVDWEQPEDKDPANPLYWKNSFKWANIAVVSLITLITYVLHLLFRSTLQLMDYHRPLASSMFAPGVPQVMEDFHSDSKMLATFVVSVYLLGFALGPVIIAPLCEMYGRIPLYASCNILFVIFSIACAVAKSLNQLIAFRFLMGCAGVAPLTIGAGTIADIMPLEKRGKAMSIYSIGPLVGPVLGPVGGGYMIQAIGWRWVYWLLAMLVRRFLLSTSSIMSLTPAISPALPQFSRL
jgi:multidrug resistance protein